MATVCQFSKWELHVTEVKEHWQMTDIVVAMKQ